MLNVKPEAKQNLLDKIISSEGHESDLVQVKKMSSLLSNSRGFQVKKEGSPFLG
jgi:hypothetical protein